MEKLAEEGCEEWKLGDGAIGRLKVTVIECMEKGYLRQGDPLLVSLSIWSFVHGLMSLAIRERMEKFVSQKDLLLPVMKSSLNWFVNNIETGNKPASADR